ncbi:hypothetical protein [Streptomyces gilvosporeus]|nr:hypothetical protein [Streptomyces gilvosporeus]
MSVVAGAMAVVSLTTVEASATGTGGTPHSGRAGTIQVKGGGCNHTWPDGKVGRADGCWSHDGDSARIAAGCTGVHGEVYSTWQHGDNLAFATEPCGGDAQAKAVHVEVGRP